MADYDCGQVVPADALLVRTTLCGAVDFADFDDLQPQLRDRCNTWPLHKPSGDLSHNTSPLIHEEIPEERSMHGSMDSGHFTELAPSATPDSASAGGSPLALSLSDEPTGKKNATRRNAWGNLSYADLITQAILSTPDKRLTLSQIYDWMVQNVPYFRDKGDSNSSAGWKNSIRHNLSLHSRFMRVQNEGAGKSSWWVINPDAKPGKSSRSRPRAHTLETKTLDKKRGRVKKKVEQQRREPFSPMCDSPDSTFFEPPPPFSMGGGEFRARSDSNVSSYSLGCPSTSRLSPQFEEFEAWAPAPPPPDLLHQDILDMATNMRLADKHKHMVMSVVKTEPATSAPMMVMQQRAAPNSYPVNPPPYDQAVTSKSNTFSHQANRAALRPKLETPDFAAPGSSACAQRQNGAGYVQLTHCPQISPPDFGARHQVLPNGVSPLKQEPPAYQELYPTSLSQIQANPMLRDALQKAHNATNRLHHPGPPPPHHQAFGPAPCQFNPYGDPAFPTGPRMGVPPYGQPPLLPSDISDIHYDRMRSRDIDCDIDAVIRHELSIAGRLDFNMDTYGS